MSWKSILFSILTIVVAVALLFVVAIMFAVNIILGIVGVIVWGVINVTLRSKALHEATGIVDKLLAKYIVPIVGAVIVTGLILIMVIPGAFEEMFWWM